MVQFYKQAANKIGIYLFTPPRPNPAAAGHPSHPLDKLKKKCKILNSVF
jgi:hypothetical protein